MVVGDLERLAVETYRYARKATDEPACPVSIARAVLRDPDPVKAVDWLAVGNGALYKVNGQQKIAVRRGIPLEAQLFAMLHEVGHVVLDRLAYRGPLLEESCDYYAACLLAPTPAMLRMCAHFGCDIRELSRRACATETWAALRIGEVTGEPVATMQPGRMRTRGKVDELPDEAAMRAAPVGPMLRGLRKVKLRCTRNRSAVLRSVLLAG